MKKRIGILIPVVLCFLSTSVYAHFGMVIPSDTMVMPQEKRQVGLTLSFSHPFEQIGMPLEKPEAFAVVHNGKRQNLRDKLESTQVMDQEGWKMEYKINRPGTYQFFMQPVPYFEPAEDCFIIHYTKTVVAAFGDDSQWDDEVGLKTEIVQQTRPFGLYRGNVFQGIVKVDGRPVPNAMVEVEYYNSTGKAIASSDYMVTQTIKADQNGCFTYAVPTAGWWGFAALNTADFKLPYQGKEKEVELGAVIWVKFEDWKTQ